MTKIDVARNESSTININAAQFNLYICKFLISFAANNVKQNLIDLYFRSVIAKNQVRSRGAGILRRAIFGIAAFSNGRTEGTLINSESASRDESRRRTPV